MRASNQSIEAYGIGLRPHSTRHCQVALKHAYNPNDLRRVDSQ